MHEDHNLLKKHSGHSHFNPGELDLWLPRGRGVLSAEDALQGRGSRG